MNKQRVKDWLNGFGWCLTTFVTIGFCGFLWLSIQPQETGYSKEMTVRMDELVMNLTPLSVSDLGDME